MKQLDFFDSIEDKLYIGCGTHNSHFTAVDSKTLKTLWNFMLSKGLKGSIRLSSSINTKIHPILNLGSIVVLHKGDSKMSLTTHTCACGTHHVVIPTKLHNDLTFVFLNVEAVLPCCRTAIKQGKFPSYKYMLTPYKDVEYAVFDAEVLKDRKDTSLFSEVPSVHYVQSTKPLKLIKKKPVLDISDFLDGSTWDIKASFIEEDDDGAPLPEVEKINDVSMSLDEFIDKFNEDNIIW